MFPSSAALMLTVDPALLGEDQAYVAGGSPARRVKSVAVPPEEGDLALEELDHVVGTCRQVRVARRGVVVGVDEELDQHVLVNVGRFGMLILNEMMPASLFDTMSVVMSGAAGFSPVESL